jgi:flavoprotein hydroxylase
MTSDELTADVAIVGLGPTGSTLAILLAQRGRSVVVLERQSAPYPLPRAVHFDDETGRILQSCGVGAELRSIIEPAEIYEWRNGADTTLLRFGRAGDGPSGWPASSMFNQPALEALLERRARSLPNIEIRRGVEVAAVREHDETVIAQGADGSVVRASYLIGCDGANSTVRTLAQLPTHDLGYFFDWLIVDVIPHRQRTFDPINVQICDPARPTTAVSGGPGRRRWEFMRLPPESLDELNHERRAWELLAPWDVHPGNAAIERHAVYTFNARYAEQWRRGRVLLAGDAAHLMPPFAGQGMCAGIRDAANLAWKLDHVLADVAPDALLDTYEQERLPHVRSVIEFSMELGKVICVPDPAEAAARDEAMAAAVGPEPAEVPALPALYQGLIHPEAPYAGELFPQGAIDGIAFDDVHGCGWRIVTIDDADGIGTADRTWFEELGGKIVALREPGVVLSRWFGDRGVLCALVRPDFRVYGTAASTTSATSLLSDLRSQLDHTRTGAPI